MNDSFATHSATHSASHSATHLTKQKFSIAVQNFTPQLSRKRQLLLSLKEGIAELRQRRASYKSIVTVLHGIGISASHGTVARFCHEVLGETTPRKVFRPRQPRTSRKLSNRVPAKDSSHPPPQKPASPVRNDSSASSSVRRGGGPRIADPNNI